MFPSYLEPIRQSYVLWSNKKLTFFSLAIILLSSISFGLWFKTKQISIASKTIAGFYPLSGYAVAIIKTLLVFSTLWLGLALINQKISLGLGKTHQARFLFLSSLPFSVFFLSWIDISLSMQVLLFVFFFGFLLLINALNTNFLETIKEPTCVLLFYLLCFFLILQSYSPLYHNTFWDTWGRNDFFINLEQQWENAKAYDFLGNFTQSGALGGHSQGVYMLSELSAIIVLIFDLPIIDLLGKYASIKFLYLGFYMFGTFGAYLFFRHGLKLSTLISIIGGLCFFWGNSPYLSYVVGEFPLHTVPFVFFPWVLLFIKLAHSFNKPALSCLAGLVASLSEYAMSSHPECDLVSFVFCNLYNLYLSLIRINRNGLGLGSVSRFFGWLLLFPVFHGIGLAYRAIPMIGAIFNKEYSISDTTTGLGLWWDGGIQRLSTVLFRFEDLSKTGVNSMGVGEHTVGWPVFFFIGQPLLFFAFAFVCLAVVTLYKKSLHKPNQYSQHASLETSFFFLVMFLFLSWNLPLGNQSWLDAFMDWTGFMRIHSAFRLTVYYFFFGLVVAMYGLNFLLHLRKLVTLNIIFLSFLIFLGVAYISPLHLAKPDKIFLDGVLLFLGYILVLSYILRHRKKPPLPQYLTSSEIFQKNKLFSSRTITLAQGNSIEVLILGLIFFSAINLNSIIKNPLLKQNNPGLKKSNAYIPARVSVTLLKNNQHDKASFMFLDKETKKFAQDFLIKRKKNLRKRIFVLHSTHSSLLDCQKFKISNKQADEKYNRIYKILSKHNYLDPDSDLGHLTSDLEHLIKEILLKMCRNSLTRPLTLALTKSKNLKILKTENGFLDYSEPTWNSFGKHLEFFNEIAPEMDNFYYLEPSTAIQMDTQTGYHGPLTYNINNIPQFYLPDKYQLFLFVNPDANSRSMPVGKKSEITAGMVTGAGPGYPSIDVAFHLRNLFYKTLDITEREGIDFPSLGVGLDQILENPNGKKLLNILGIDFLIFLKYYLNSLPPTSFYFPTPKMTTPSEKMKGLLSMGLTPFELPKSYKIAPRFLDHYGTHVLKNPESYGKAFIAKWVKFIKPEENHFNKTIFELGMKWPKSRELLEHFNKHLSEIPDTQGATLIESIDDDGFKINPQTYESNSSVDIVKIIASKAVFDVDCKEGHCWLVYNTAALNGWKAYSGSDRLKIHKANLGFIGVKLKRGKQYVWMEYQPWLPTVGLLIALSGWIFTFVQLIDHRKFHPAK